MVPKGGPDGGDGGKGGDVWLVADHNVASLLAFRDHPHRRADNGKHGSGQKKHGSSGADFEAKVPIGTTVKNFEDGTVLVDLAKHGDRWLAAAGGAGGRGNARFLSNTRRAPKFAEQGEDGAQDWVRLELKLLADIALVGFPNAGKSTLISRVSRAKPKIANYPFTTLEPNLGVVQLDDFDFVVADIPGLIEGAAEGAGLGTRFLRHVARTRLLLHLVDVAPVDETHPLDNLIVIENELLSYSQAFAERPVMIVLNKIDLVDEEELTALQAQFTEEFPEREISVISAVTGAGIDALVHRLQDAVVDLKQALAEDEAALAADNDLQQRISQDVMAQSMGVAVPAGLDTDSTDGSHDDDDDDSDDNFDVEVVYTNE